MTLPMRVTRKCAVCGRESGQIVLASSNTFFGTPDLDLRPAEMMRSTMHWWIQKCPHCGYISKDLSNESSVTQECLKAKDFASCNGICFLSELAEQFYQYYLINMADGNVEDAFHAILHAAWACDDNSEEENAKHCRKLALAEIEKMIDLQELSENIFVVRADLLRRTGQFDTLIDEYTGRQFSEDLLNQIVSFQIEKAHQQDTACYRIEDVTSGNE